MKKLSRTYHKQKKQENILPTIPLWALLPLGLWLPAVIQVSFKNQTNFDANKLKECLIFDGVQPFDGPVGFVDPKMQVASGSSSFKSYCLIALCFHLTFGFTGGLTGGAPTKG